MAPHQANMVSVIHDNHCKFYPTSWNAAAAMSAEERVCKLILAVSGYRRAEITELNCSELTKVFDWSTLG